MRKFIAAVIILLVVFCPMTIKASEKTELKNAEQVEEFKTYLENFKTKYDVVKDVDFNKYLEDVVETGSGELNLEGIVKTAGKYMVGEIGSSIKVMVMMASLVILSAFLMNIQTAFKGNSVSQISFYALYSLIMLLLMSNLYIGIEVCKNTIEVITSFMIMLLPVLLSLLMGIGGFAEAIAMDPIVVMTVNVCTTVVSDFLLPLILIVTVLRLINNLSEEDKLSKLTSLMSSVVKYTQGFMLTIFIGIISIRGVTSSTFDKVAIETAKYTVDNFIPIVGGALSDTVTTIANYSLLIKNGLSAIGLIVVASLILFPIIKMFVLYLINKFTAAILEPIGDKKIINSISEVGDSLMQVISCLILVSLMFFILIGILAAAKPM